MTSRTSSTPPSAPRTSPSSPRERRGTLHLGCVVLADAGNVHDALFLGARAALCNTLVPVTRPIEYRAPGRAWGGRGNDDEGGGGMDTNGAGLDTRHAAHAGDFELAYYWSEGAALEGRDRWPVCVTLNLMRTSETCGPGCGGEGLRCIHCALYPHRYRRRTSWMRRRRKTPPSHCVSSSSSVRPADTTWHATDRLWRAPARTVQFKSLVQDSLKYASL
ncbi:hypothetical protein JB92DRAFT_3205234 [Gautieria morchelliformis]|nr:hypothetical protein JB92DRAFT_3205234 [Gautieria morchelliformis]